MGQPMKALEFEVEVTADAIGRALPDMREVIRIARHEYFQRRRYVSQLKVLGYIAAAFGLLSSLALMFDNLAWGYGAAFCIAACLLFRLDVERLRQRIDEWALEKSWRRLMQAAPYLARYRLDEHGIETRIEKFNVERRRAWARVAKIFLGDHAVIFTMRGFALRPSLFIVPATLDQYKQLETQLRACKLEVVPLPPKFVPQWENT
jgi:hypothetical protein